FWTDGPYREELRRSLHVLWSRPNPGERVVPFLAERDGDPVGSAVLFEQSPVASLHGVGTVPGDRSRGIASSLVAAALDALDPGTVGAVVLATDSPRAAGRLDELGFTTLSEFEEYELPPGAHLAMPDPGPAQPPRWRPPRAPGGASTPSE
ncbi:MAG: GNAT family N-acetyltransferase, partial [Thermoplasmata archaeon]|nr:GNAT family N-acetyltransferase [Thermoplasmata archaeon]